MQEALFVLECQSDVAGDLTIQESRTDEGMVVMDGQAQPPHAVSSPMRSSNPLRNASQRGSSSNDRQSSASTSLHSFASAAKRTQTRW